VQSTVQLWSVNQRTTEVKIRYRKMSSENMADEYSLWRAVKTSERRLRRLSVE
jgi:hypothetical protein